jgi:hypothetical protein
LFSWRLSRVRADARLGIGGGACLAMYREGVYLAAAGLIVNLRHQRQMEVGSGRSRGSEIGGYRYLLASLKRLADWRVRPTRKIDCFNAFFDERARARLDIVVR